MHHAPTITEAHLHTACGCERLLRTSYPPPFEIRVPMRATRIAAWETDPLEPGKETILRVSVFHLVQCRDAIRVAPGLFPPEAHYDEVLE